MIVHINASKKEQKAEEHFIGTAELCRERGKMLGIEYTAYIAGLLHDLGKNKKEFEEYLRDSIENSNSRRRGEIDHSTTGGQFIYNNYHNDKRLAAEIISTSIFSHHCIINMVDIDGEEAFLKRTNKKNIGYAEALKNSEEFLKQYDFDDLIEKSSMEIEKICNKIRKFVKDNGLRSNSNYFMRGSLQRLVTSVLIDADRTDTAAFMTESKSDNNIDYNELWKNYITRLDAKLNEFKRLDDDISVLRRKMSDECFEFAQNKCGIYRLPIPTGGGKTLASLRFALEHCRQFKKERIIYTAPYLSILEQNAAEIKSILKDDENIFEHHSNVFRGNDNDDEKNCYEYLGDAWTSPVILTSMVKLLEAMFSANTSSVRRFNRLANSVIIIDEIQSLPIKTISMFNIMANFLSYMCNTTIVLCSATQPLLDVTENKIVYGKPANMIENVENINDSFKRVRVIDETRTKKYTTQELADFVLEKTENNMLVILNTKSNVNKLCDELRSRKSEYEIYQLTTYMCPQHRNDVIAEIKRELGNKKLICVSTQLIEAGVDISFDNVIRAVAGLDSIIQAAGRCNRNGESKMRNVYVIKCHDENIGSLEDIKKGQKYMERILDAYAKEHDKQGDDFLLSPRAIDIYYRIYFEGRKDDMDYSMGGRGLQRHLFELLSNGNLKEKGKNGTLMVQSYKSAGDAFKVIDSNTIGVIVPYKTAVEKIERLNSAKSLIEIKQLVRELQRYTVNIDNNSKIFNELKERNAVYSLLDDNIYIVSPGFYDERLGLNTDMENYVF